jgi:hypothetical protein
MASKFKSFILATAVMLSAIASDNLYADDNSGPRKFSIALIGDFPYTQEKLLEADNLMANLNAHKELSFVIHDGDFKGGSVPCDDQVYNDRLATFNQSEHPLFYVFGDNEWTDCHRAAAGSYNPFDRLALLRSLFSPFDDKFSFGEKKLPLTRQSAAFPENIRWFKSNVLFVGLHIPGSNNGLSTAAQYQTQANAEYQARNAANLAFLAQSFDLAKRKNSPGILITIQANIWDFIPATGLTGFEGFMKLLEQKTREFGKPVVLVHGDSHYFRIDKPLPSALPSEVLGSSFPIILPWDSTKLKLENFTRVETFGNPYTHWVKASIDTKSPNVFTFEPMIVEKNRAPAP